MQFTVGEVRLIKHVMSLGGMKGHDIKLYGNIYSAIDLSILPFKEPTKPQLAKDITPEDKAAAEEKFANATQEYIHTEVVIAFNKIETTVIQQALLGCTKYGADEASVKVLNSIFTKLGL